MSTITKPIAGPPPTDAAWHDFRLSGIFASEAAAACGLSPYKQPLDVYLAKRGMAEPFEGNEYTARGKRFESWIAEEYTLQTGNEIRVGLPVFRHPELPFMGATPDGALVDDPKRGVEFKACNFRRAAQLGEEGTDEIFEDWLCQVQQQMAVMGWDRCDVFVMISLHEYRLYPVERNDKMIARMVELEADLWDRILRGEPPEPNFTHPGTLDLVKSMHGVAEGTAAELGYDAVAAWGRWVTAKQELKRAEQIRDRAQAELLHAMGVAEVGTLQGVYDNGRQVQLVRTAIDPQLWTDADIEEAQDKLGQVKRKGYVKLAERKSKDKGNTQ